MAQLVGQNCVRCRERISSELDARFCAACGCPVHDRCRPAPGVDPEGGTCATCGAPAAHVAARAPEVQQNELEQARRNLSGSGVIWFATRERLRRVMKTAWSDDQGGVDAVPGGVRFVGRWGSTVMRDVRSIEVVVPVVPWGQIVGAVGGVVIVLAMSAAGMFKHFTLDNPGTYVMLGAITSFGLAASPFRWVRVEYGGERPGVAYLTPASIWDRWTGGTQRLAARIRNLVDQNAKPAAG